MKQCKIRKTASGWGWLIDEGFCEEKKAEDVCILAIHLDKKINLGSLLNYRKHGLISLRDYRAIRQFDINMGTEKHLKQMKSLAKYLKLELVGDCTLD